MANARRLRLKNMKSCLNEKKVYRNCGNQLFTANKSAIFNVSSFAAEDSIG